MGVPPLSPTVGPGAVLVAAAPAPTNSSLAAGPAWALPLHRSGDYSSYYLLFPLLLLLPSSSSSGPPPAVPARPRRRRRAPEPPPPALPGPGAQVGLGHPAALLPRSAARQGRRGQGEPLPGIGAAMGKGEARVVGGAEHNGVGCSQHHPAPCIPGLLRVPAPQLRPGKSSGVVVPYKILTRFLGVV